MRWEEEARNGALLEIAKKWSNNKIMVRRLLLARKKTLLV
jgi:hypothetical protein